MADTKQENQGNSNQFCKIISNAVTRKSYNVFLMDEICEPHNYVDLFNILKTVDDEDEINIFINSPGGYVYTSVQIALAIRGCKACVTGHLESTACSGAGLIFLACNRHVAYQHGMFMCHYYTGAEFGKGHEIKIKIEFMDKYMKDLYVDFYKDFMTHDELERVFQGTDYWFNYSETVTRLKRMHKIRLESKKRKEKLTLGTVVG